MRKEIYRIAKNARKWSERYVRKNPDDFFLDLGCFCAIGSSYLSQKLKQANIKHELVIYNGIGLSHCFIKTDDYLIDITATQFNINALDKTFKQVEILSTEELEKRNKNPDSSPYFWEITKTFKDYKELLDYQKDNNWPIEQRIDGYPDINKYFL